MSRLVPDLPHDQLEERFPGGFTFRDEANALVAKVFRNGPIEDLHAGKDSPLLDDPGLSRITNAEMKLLILTACQRLEALLIERYESPMTYFAEIIPYNIMYCGRWER